MLLIILFSRAGCTVWKRDGGIEEAAAVSLTPSSGLLCDEGLSEIMSVFSRSPGPLAWPLLLTGAFSRTASLLTMPSWLFGWFLLSGGLGDVPSEVALQVISSSSPGFSLLLYLPWKTPIKNRHVWTLNKIWAKILYNSTNRNNCLNRIFSLHPFPQLQFLHS